MRTFDILALAVAIAIAACQPPPPTLSPAAQPTAPVPSGPVASTPIAPLTKALQYGTDAYLERLFAAFRECGRHEVPKFDGHWLNSESAERDIWICEGRIRWQAGWGRVSDICFSRISVVAGGFDAEGTWHEDLHDPGDASGLALYVRQREGRLVIDVADWEDPTHIQRFFTLERAPDPADHPGMRCPVH